MFCFPLVSRYVGLSVLLSSFPGEADGIDVVPNISNRSLKCLKILLDDATSPANTAHKINILPVLLLCTIFLIRGET